MSSKIPSHYIEAIQTVSNLIGGVRPSKDQYEAARNKPGISLPNSRSMVRAAPWADICRAAGFSVDLPNYVELQLSDDEILSLLKNLHSLTQAPLSLAQVVANTPLTPIRLSRRFGGLQAACALAGVPCTSTRKYNADKADKQFTDLQILRLLVDLYDRHKVPVNTALIQADEEFPLHRNTITERFKTIRNACELANVPYDDPTKKASKVLDRLEELTGYAIEREASFEWLRNPLTGRKMRFDGFIKEHNLAIELDGCSHFSRSFHIRMFADPEGYDKLVGRDLAKNSLSGANGVVLLRLRYTQTPSSMAQNISLVIESLGEAHAI